MSGMYFRHNSVYLVVWISGFFSFLGFLLVLQLSIHILEYTYLFYVTILVFEKRVRKTSSGRSFAQKNASFFHTNWGTYLYIDVCAFQAYLRFQKSA
mgnify:CR=1 FL=1